MAMGIAEVIPGVSGGTIAFITGIYFELLAAIRSLRPQLLTVLVRDGIVAAWQHCNATFLALLAAGMLTSIVLFARLIGFLLEHYPIPVWAFFFGLIFASALVLAREIGAWRAPVMLMLLAGITAGVLLARSMPLAGDVSLLFVFAAGAVAVCAWILPGVSGSFILLLLGVYAPTLRAVETFDVTYLAVLAMGCAIGLLSFAQVLGWLLERARTLLMALLVGFMAGSLIKLWPWQQIVVYVINDSGESKPVVTTPISPWQFAESTGDPAMTGWAIATMLCGVAAVVGMDMWGRRSGES